MENWVERILAAIEGDVFNDIELRPIKSAVIGYGVRSSDFIEAMKEIIATYPNTPMAKIAIDQIKGRKENISK